MGTDIVFRVEERTEHGWLPADTGRHDWSHPDTAPDRPGPQWSTAGAEFLAVILRMVRLAGPDLTRVRCVYWFS